MTNPTGDALKASAAQVETIAKAMFKTDWPRDDWDRFGPKDFATERYRAMAVTAIAALSPVEQAPQPVDDGPLTVSFPVHQIVHNLLLAHTGQEGGCPKIDWYRLRSEISDAIAVALDDQRKLDMPPPPTEAPPVESQAAEIRAKALEEAAKIADAAGIEWAADAELWLKDGHPNTAAVSKQHSRAAENVAAAIRAALAAEGSAE